MLGTTRQSIREGLVEALSGISSVEGRISYGYPEFGKVYPSICYTVSSEERFVDGSYMVSDDNPNERIVRIEVEGRAEIKDGTDYPMDDLSLEIERSIASGVTLNRAVDTLELNAVTYELEEETEDIGLIKLDYSGFYTEAEELALSDVSFSITSTAFTATSTSNIAGKMKVRIYSPWSTTVYSDIESAHTTSHFNTAAGLIPSTVYGAYVIFEADVGGESVGEAEEYGYTDGSVSYLFMTPA